MWRDWPMNDTVFWPRDEGVIGVLGVAPVATADFLFRLVKRQTRKDWHHPRIIVDSNPKIPSRGRHLELGETDPTPFLAAGIANLEKNGATIVAVPCNTAHIFYEGYAKNRTAHVPNMVDIVAKSLANKKIGKALLLASRYIVRSEIYEKACNNYNIEIVNFKNQNLITEIIESVKQNKNSEQLYHALADDIATYCHCHAVILGCTELSCIASLINNMQIVDSNTELAEYCIQYVHNGSRYPQNNESTPSTI